VDRIHPLELQLGDAITIGGPQTGDWARVIGLALDGDAVVVTLADGTAPIRLPLGALVTVVRAAALPADVGDERAFDDQMANLYSGDVDAAGVAVAGHAADLRGAVPGVPRSIPGRGMVRKADLVGIYGGDLDHVVDALGGHDDPAARQRRASAEQRSAAVAAARSQPAHEAEETDDEAVEAAERVTGAFG